MAEDCLLPMKWVGPINIKFEQEDVISSVEVPLATYESPLWPSVDRGGRISKLIGGVRAIILSDNMTRSIVVSAESAYKAKSIVQHLKSDKAIEDIVRKTSKFAQLLNWEARIIGKNIYLRLNMYTDEAAGHNMVTKAADAVIKYVTGNYLVDYVSVSGNYCIDKKVSAVNSILGRGKSVTVEGWISYDVCKKYLKSSPEAIHNLNIQKNYIGSIISGSICSANAHYTNMLLAAYLATGQDAANIVEASQGITTTEILNKSGQDVLYFSVNLPNIIVGTIGNGKGSLEAQKRLKRLKCFDSNNTEYSNSRRLAMIIASTVWCGELSLLAAQTNPGELMKGHLYFERNQRT